MSKVAVGSIPEKINYIYSDQKEVAVGCAWDISWYDNNDGPKTVKEKVTPAFPADGADDKMLKRAKEWAEQAYYGQEKKISQSTVVDNKPIKNVRLLSLEERGQGGRAYKAVIDNFYVDFREDVLMDTLLKAGVKEGGVLQGEYIWAKMGSQMKLVRIGSELHRLIVEFDSKKDIKPVGKGDLEIGGVYQDRKKNKVIFVGYVNTIVFKSTATGDRWTRQRFNDKPTFDFKKTAKKKSMLFFEIWSHEKLDDAVKSMVKKDNVYNFKIKSSHTYIEKVDQVKIPDNIIETLRNKARDEMKEQILEYVGKKAPKQNYARIDAWGLEDHLEYNSSHLNLVPYGTDADVFDVKKFLVFS